MQYYSQIPCLKVCQKFVFKCRHQALKKESHEVFNVAAEGLLDGMWSSDSLQLMSASCQLPGQTPARLTRRDHGDAVSPASHCLWSLVNVSRDTGWSGTTQIQTCHLDCSCTGQCCPDIDADLMLPCSQDASPFRLHSFLLHLTSVYIGCKLHYSKVLLTMFRTKILLKLNVFKSLLGRNVLL